MQNGPAFYLVAFGDIANGFTLFGPFNTLESAEDYGERNQGSYTITKIYAPIGVQA